MAFSIQAVEFNADFLDVDEKTAIDLSQFSDAGYIMPGDYTMSIVLNGKLVSEKEFDVEFYETEANSSQPCITSEIINHIGLKEKLQKTLKWEHGNRCLDLTSLSGARATGDLSRALILLSMPQNYIEYQSDNWVPPSQWDDGIDGLLFDYNVHTKYSMMHSEKNNTINTTGYGIAGANVGAWRFRGDWQAYSYKENHQSRNDPLTGNTSFHFSRIYAYRGFRDLGAKLTVGETYLDSNIFDSFHFTGMSLMSDENMLPSHLRDYAPEIVGVAKSNAKVIISQQGRVLYQTQVAPGQFRIRETSLSMAGTVDVRVEEEDGTLQQFQVNAARVPFLTRPGAFRYQFSFGRPSNFEHQFEGDQFGAGEFSWGVRNGWSLYGGALLSKQVFSAALGTGLDLSPFGAISADVTKTRVKENDENKIGNAYRINYTKLFEESGGQISFSGYQFSRQGYFNNVNRADSDRATEGNRLVDLLWHQGQDSLRRQYNMVISKQMFDKKIDVHFDYSHRFYWYQPSSLQYSLSFSGGFFLGAWRELSAGLTFYHRSQGGHKNDNGAFLTLSLPLGYARHISYNSNIGGGTNSHSVSYFNKVNESDYYSLSTSLADDSYTFSGNYTHDGDKMAMTANISHQPQSITTVGVAIQGGMTLTPEGGAFHRTDILGSSRVLFDTDSVADVPIRGYGLPTHSNRFGKAALADVSNYLPYRSQIDMNLLGQDVDALGNTVQKSTLTEGAIGYRHFTVLSGAKRMVELRLEGDFPAPFGAIVTNKKNQQIGMVSEGGLAYLSGLHRLEKIFITWGDHKPCAFWLPDDLLNEEDYLKVHIHCQLENAAPDGAITEDNKEV